MTLRLNSLGMTAQDLLDTLLAHLGQGNSLDIPVMLLPLMSCEDGTYLTEIDRDTFTPGGSEWLVLVGDREVVEEQADIDSFGIPRIQEVDK